jgi:putative transposase
MPVHESIPDRTSKETRVGGALCAATLPHSSALRRNRVSLPQHIYHVTKRLAPGVSHSLDLTDFGQILIDAFLYQRAHGSRLFAFVVMLDHIHWLFAIPESRSLATCVQVTFNWASTQINRDRHRKGRLWQDGYYDHLLRDSETVTGLVRYIEENPVRKGLCDTAQSWAWSSACPGNHQHLDRDWLSFHRFE